MAENPIVRAVKWGVSIIVPAGAMYFLFANTNINFVLVMCMALALCVGFLFIFRLVVVPGSKAEIEVLKEEAILKQTLALLFSLTAEAGKTARPKTIELTEVLVGLGRDLVKKMLEDQLITLQISIRINQQLIRLVQSLSDCNNLKGIANKEVNSRLARIEKDILPRTISALEMISMEYAAGRLLEVDMQLRSLESLFDVFGYIPGKEDDA